MDFGARGGIGSSQVLAWIMCQPSLRDLAKVTLSLSMARDPMGSDPLVFLSFSLLSLLMRGFAQVVLYLERGSLFANINT